MSLNKCSLAYDYRDKPEVRENLLTRRYIDNIFKNKVEESMVEIERMRSSFKRHQRKLEATGTSTDAVWNHSDLFTAQGSIFALAVLLLQKLEE